MNAVLRASLSQAVGIAHDLYELPLCLVTDLAVKKAHKEITLIQTFYCVDGYQFLGG